MLMLSIFVRIYVEHLLYPYPRYALIIFEEIVDFNKAAVGLLMSGALWTIYSGANPHP